MFTVEYQDNISSQKKNDEDAVYVFAVFVVKELSLSEILRYYWGMRLEDRAGTASVWDINGLKIKGTGWEDVEKLKYPNIP